MNTKQMRTLFITGFLLLFCCFAIGGCAVDTIHNSQEEIETESVIEKIENDRISDWRKMNPIGKMELDYADQFSVDYYENDYALITIGDADKYLIIPKGLAIPKNLDSTITCIPQGCDKIYLAASSAMDFFRELDSLDHVGMTSTKQTDWSIPEVTAMLERGDMIYAGKYSAPDYEMLTAWNTALAIESTMIYHSPQTSEKLELLGIPVMVERSSYESKPLGRMEWIKLYGVLLGEEEKAEAFFKDQVEKMDALFENDSDMKSGEEVKTAFFYITSSGMINVRKNGDYVPEMIRMAGGTYVPSSAGSDSENALSTMNMQMEQFYTEVVDADILIYNSTIEGELINVDELISKNALFTDFEAVKEGRVYSTGKNMFQQPTAMAEMIIEMYTIIHDEDTSELVFLHELQ